MNQTIKLSALCKLLTDPAVQRIVVRTFTERNSSIQQTLNLIKAWFSHQAQRSVIALDKSHPPTWKTGCASFATDEPMRWTSAEKPAHSVSPCRSHLFSTVSLSCVSYRWGLGIFLCVFSYCLRCTGFKWLAQKWLKTPKSAWVLTISIQVCCSDFNHVFTRISTHHQMEQHNHFSISVTAVV